MVAYLAYNHTCQFTMNTLDYLVCSKLIESENQFRNHPNRFEGYEIGILSSLRPFISFLGAPFWSAISDKFHIHRIILVGTMFTSIVSRFENFFFNQ